MAEQSQVQQNDQAMDAMAEEGRGTDTVMAHMTIGEIVIPLPLAQNERFVEMLTMYFELLGADIEEFTVGNPKQKINPETGHPEFGFFSKLWKAVTAPVKAVVNVTKDVISTTKNVVSTIGSTVDDVAQNAIKGNVGGAVSAVGTGISNIGSAVDDGAQQALKDTYTGVTKTIANTLDAVGMLPKAPPVQGPSDSSPSTITQGETRTSASKQSPTWLPLLAVAHHPSHHAPWLGQTTTTSSTRAQC